MEIPRTQLNLCGDVQVVVGVDKWFAIVHLSLFVPLDSIMYD